MSLLPQRMLGPARAKDYFLFIELGSTAKTTVPIPSLATTTVSFRIYSLVDLFLSKKEHLFYHILHIYTVLLHCTVGPCHYHRLSSPHYSRSAGRPHARSTPPLSLSPGVADRVELFTGEGMCGTCITALHCTCGGCTARIAFLRAGAYQGRCMMRRTIWGRGRACIPHGMMGGVVLCLSLHTASAPVVVAAAALHAPANHFISSHRFAVPFPHHTARSRRRGCASLRGYDGCVLECGLARHGGVRDGTTLRLCPVSGVYFLFSS